MKQPGFKLVVGILFFTIALISAVLAQYHPETKLLIRMVLVLSIIYLALGWYIFRSYFQEGSFPVLFLMGYLYSGVFLASVFGATQWPMSGTMVPFSLVYVLAQILIIVKIHKKLSRESLIQLLIEAALMLGLSILLIIRL